MEKDIEYRLNLFLREKDLFPPQVAFTAEGNRISMKTVQGDAAYSFTVDASTANARDPTAGNGLFAAQFIPSGCLFGVKLDHIISHADDRACELESRGYHALQLHLEDDDSVMMESTFQEISFLDARRHGDCALLNSNLIAMAHASSSPFQFMNDLDFHQGITEESYASSKNQNVALFPVLCSTRQGVLFSRMFAAMTTRDIAPAEELSFKYTLAYWR